MDLFWTPPNLHDDAERVELCICGPAKTNELLFGLINEINQGVDSYEADEDEIIVVYDSVEKANAVLHKLYEKLSGLYPDLIGDPEGPELDNDVLHFKGSEVGLGD